MISVMDLIFRKFRKKFFDIFFEELVLYGKLGLFEVGSK